PKIEQYLLNRIALSFLHHIITAYKITVTGPVFRFYTLCFLIRRKNPYNYFLASLASHLKQPSDAVDANFRISSQFSDAFLRC
ncbi:MAG: hypothetical protein ACKPKO_11440, partial [Candidatus Fonsibacter sp.]